MGCPPWCDCRRAVIGVFGLALCVWTALHSPALLGADFGTMIARLVFPPHSLPPMLIAWAVAVAGGLWLTITGIRPALEEGDDARSWMLSLAAVAGGAAALMLGWRWPGPFWSLASQGAESATLTAGIANIGLSLAARGYTAGFRAGLGRIGASSRADPGWQAIIDQQSTTIAMLTAERDRLAHDLAQAGPAARDLEEVLRFPDTRRALFKLNHPDGHPANEARLWKERFQKVSAVFDRLGVRS